MRCVLSGTCFLCRINFEFHVTSLLSAKRANLNPSSSNLYSHNRPSSPRTSRYRSAGCLYLSGFTSSLPSSTWTLWLERPTRTAPYNPSHPLLTTMASSSSNVVGVHYRVGKKIGEGSFGVIFEGTNLLNNQQVAIKFVGSLTADRSRRQVG